MYNDELEERKASIDGATPWVWIKSDHGAFDGPQKDWINGSRDLYLKYCKKFDTVICAGGNCGMYPRLFSQHFRHVYTFEPDPLNFHCLVNNCQSDNIIKIQAALGSYSGMVSIMRRTMDNVGEHHVGTQAGFIPMLPLDSFAFHTVDLIQLDVEGFEAQVIMGAIRTINTHKPVLSLENGHKADMKDMMDQLGYMMMERAHADSIYIPR